GTTNALHAVAEQAASGHLVAAIATVEALREKHMAVVAELLGDDDVAREIAADESVLLDVLAHLAEALSVLGHVTERSLDAISSIGEQLSAPIITAAFIRAGVDAVLVDSRQVMITNASFGRAEPLPESIAAACRDHLAPLVRAGKVPVLGGYLGATVQGVTTTLGRGGSDYSASLLGAALEADAIEIWTDVDGMLTADPRVVDDARLIEHIRFDEAAELASFGARVLHPNTIAPAVRRGIPVFVFNSLKPAGKGTRITFDAPRLPVRAIAGKANVVIVKVRSARMLATPGALRAIFEVFERNRRGRRRGTRREQPGDGTGAHGHRRCAPAHGLAERDGHQPYADRGRRRTETGDSAAARGVLPGGGPMTKTEQLRLAVIGDGKMGQAIASLAAEQGFEVVALLGERQVLPQGITKSLLDGADVAVEFTTPQFAGGNRRGCVAAGCRVVCGTTGWDSARAEVEEEVLGKKGALLWAPNFSIGVHLFASIVEYAARLVA